MKECNFKEFNEMVDRYYPLNKKKSRYLIIFKNGQFAFYQYDYDKIRKMYTLTKEPLRSID